MCTGQDAVFHESSGGGDTARTGRISEKSEKLLSTFMCSVHKQKTGTVLLYNGT